MKKCIYKKQRKNSGQVMLLSVLMIGSAFLLFTSIFGYATVQRIRMSSNLVDSTQAIIAADACAEYWLYNIKNNSAASNVRCDTIFSNPKIKLISSKTGSTIKIVAKVNKSARAFELRLY